MHHTCGFKYVLLKKVYLFQLVAFEIYTTTKTVDRFSWLQLASMGSDH